MKRIVLIFSLMFLLCMVFALNTVADELNDELQRMARLMQ
jgi:ABC-type dipeptide/oligopeptide/nickel transport system permease subunit